MCVDSLFARAVKVARKGGKDSFEVRWATSYVVPLVADLVPSGRIKRERVTVAVKHSVERHSGVDAVIQSAFDDISKLSIARGRQHTPVPHHVADGGTALTIGAEVRQLVGIAEGFAI